MKLKFITIATLFFLETVSFTVLPEVRLTDKQPQIKQAFEMPISHCGQSSADKLRIIRVELSKRQIDYLLLTSPEDVCWTANIRGYDNPETPIVTSYMLITPTQATLFVDRAKIPVELNKRLQNEGIILADYQAWEETLGTLPTTSNLFLETSRQTAATRKALPADSRITEGISPVAELKCIKNEAELKGFNEAMIRDGIALTRFYIWLEKQLKAGHKVTEISAGDRLTAFRAEQPEYISNSFENIIGYGPNAADIHYMATPETDTQILPKGMLEIDSGGQYLCGTTDITRTIALGETTDEMKTDYTQVLKGHIAVASAKFPAGTTGAVFEMLERDALWRAGKDYKHGSGHGIGHCLVVHEGPQGIGVRNTYPLKPNMLLSNEPGLYREGKYGLRTENLIRVKEDCTTEFGTFYSFETITLCYIDTSLIIQSLLTSEEINWLNQYNEQVYQKLSTYLTPDEKSWLREKTRKI